MPKSTVTNIAATWLRTGTPKKNLLAEKRIVIRATGGEGGLGLLTFTPPAPAGAVYKSVKFKMYNSSAAAGAETLYLNRVTSGWNVTKVTYDTRPNYTTAGRVSASRSNAPKNSVWEFDITSFMNAVSQGTINWYGFMITSGTAAVWRYFYHPRSDATAYIPVVEFEWYENPAQPQDLTPSDGRHISVAKPILQCDYFDINGENTIAGIQVQINTVNTFPGSGGGYFDSGPVVTDSPQFDLEPTAYSINTGTVYYWRVRVKDNTDLWSEWSDVETFQRSAKPTLTINSPASPPGNIVEDSTPPILWGVTGGTQKSWQVLVWDETKAELVWDSGKTSGTDTSYTLSANWWLGLVNKYSKGLEEGKVYNLEVRIWDALDRATLQNDPAYVTVERSFTFVPTATVTPAANLTVINQPNTPWARLEFTRTSAPDTFEILRNGVIIDTNVDPSMLDISEGKYVYIDRTAPPRRQHKWVVRSVVNGKASASNPEVLGTIRPRVAYLCSSDGKLVIPFFNASPDITPVTDGTQISAKNSPEAITVYMGGGGRVGTFAGIITGDIGGQSSQTYLNRLLSLREKANLGKPMILTYIDQSISCVISNIASESISWSDSVGYACSFSLTEKV